MLIDTGHVLKSRGGGQNKTGAFISHPDRIDPLMTHFKQKLQLQLNLAKCAVEGERKRGADRRMESQTDWLVIGEATK